VAFAHIAPILFQDFRQGDKEKPTGDETMWFIMCSAQNSKAFPGGPKGDIFKTWTGKM